MDRGELERCLVRGESLEAIGRRFGRDASTVGYWVRKYGLSAAHRDRHLGRGGLSLEQLQPRIEAGLSHRAIATELGVSQSTVRHWVKRYGLVSRRSRSLLKSAQAGAERPPRAMLECLRHGLVEHRIKTNGSYRCPKCSSEAVTRRRRRVKAILVAEAGGRCVLCGYDRHVGALEFHHVDPATKSFSLSHAGVTRSLASARGEAKKCALLCANCHAEVEGGIVNLPDEPRVLSTVPG